MPVSAANSADDSPLSCQRSTRFAHSTFVVRIARPPWAEHLHGVCAYVSAAADRTDTAFPRARSQQAHARAYGQTATGSRARGDTSRQRSQAGPKALPTARLRSISPRPLEPKVAGSAPAWRTDGVREVRITSVLSWNRSSERNEFRRCYCSACFVEHARGKVRVTFGHCHRRVAEKIADHLQPPRTAPRSLEWTRRPRAIGPERIAISPRAVCRLRRRRPRRPARKRSGCHLRGRMLRALL